VNRTLEIWAESAKDTDPLFPDNEYSVGYAEAMSVTARWILKLRDEEIEAEFADAQARGVAR
jgi:hypothetical protein